MDLSVAQLEPFRALHFFHERLNIYVKAATAGMLLLRDRTAAGQGALGELIRDAHPSWGSPPIHEMSKTIASELFASVTAFGIVAAFSALDDFITGVDGEISRAESEGVSIARHPTPEGEEISRMYHRYGWKLHDPEGWIQIVSYFRIVRNCIVHRSSRCSAELEVLSGKDEVTRLFAPLLPVGTATHPIFMEGQVIEMDPVFAIMCSDLIRKAGADINQHYIRMMGNRGFFRNVVHYVLNDPNTRREGAKRTPEAALNSALCNTYRVVVSDRLDSVRSLTSLGLWKMYLDEYNKISGA